MAIEVKLVIDDQPGGREVLVESARFSLGRSAENDLVIDVVGLSRKHAVLETKENEVWITDLGSRNGTLVNHRRIDQPTRLNDGDLISLGELSEMRISIKPVRQVSSIVDSKSAKVIRYGAPAIAAIAVCVILGGALLALMMTGKKKNQPDLSPAESPSPVVVLKASILTGSTVPCEDLSLDQVERGAKQIIRVISNDSQDYAFPAGEGPRQSIKTEIRNFCGQSSIGRAIDLLNQNHQIIEAEAQGKLKPSIALIAALVETDGGRSGDPVAAARRMIPELARRRVTFEGKTADSTLIAIAAYPEPYDGRGRHPLVARNRNAVKGALGDLNIWYLSNGALTPAQYQFVVRFLALGIIARSPKQYGIDGPALRF